VIDALRAEHQGNRVHSEEPDGPTECTFVTAHDFKSLFIEAVCVNTDYSRWVLETNFDSAYAYHKQFLQVLQSQAPGIWSLKMPSHAVCVDALMKAYPDARIIWTHRDPFRAAGSLFSLQAASNMMTLSKPDLRHVVATYPYQLHEHVRRPMAVMDRSDRDPFYHLFYEDVVHNPIGEMRKLFDWLGDDFTPETESAMNGWLAANPQGKFGKHAYTLEQFGLTKAALMPYFEDYLKRFDIAMEG